MDLDKKIFLIYDQLERENYNEAIKLLTPLTSRPPHRAFLHALLAYAQQKSGQYTAALKTAEFATSLKPRDLGTLQNLTTVFRSHGQGERAIELFREAFNALDLAKLNNLTYQSGLDGQELAKRYLQLLIREHKFDLVQSVALRMAKALPSKAKQYWLWVIMCLVLQAEQRKLSGQDMTKDISYPLAERYLSKVTSDGWITEFEELMLHYSVYINQDKLTDALNLLNTSSIAKSSKVASKLPKLKLTLLQSFPDLQKERQAIARTLLVSDPDDWTAYLAYIQASAQCGDQEAAHAFLVQLQNSHPNVRGPFLGELELFTHQKSQAEENNFKLLIKYLDRFGTKTCAYEDLAPYLPNLSTPITANTLLTDLISQKSKLEKEEDLSVAKLMKLVNLHKLIHHIQPDVEELDRINSLIKLYNRTLPLGAKLVRTEKQYGDDLVLLAAHDLLFLASTNHNNSQLNYRLLAIALLEFGLTRSPTNHQLKVLLIRLYHQLGSFSGRVSELYHSLDIKHVQLDTLSYLQVDPCISLLQFTSSVTAAQNARTIYDRNRAETPEMLVKAFQFNSFTKIPEFLKFQDRLEHSIQRRITDLNLVRGELLSSLPSSSPQALLAWINILVSVPDPALLIPDNLTDNRDYTVLLSFTQDQTRIAIQSQLEPKCTMARLRHMAMGYNLLQKLICYIRLLYPTAVKSNAKNEQQTSTGSIDDALASLSVLFDQANKMLADSDSTLAPSLSSGVMPSHHPMLSWTMQLANLFLPSLPTEFTDQELIALTAFLQDQVSSLNSAIDSTFNFSGQILCSISTLIELMQPLYALMQLLPEQLSSSLSARVYDPVQNAIGCLVQSLNDLVLATPSTPTSPPNEKLANKCASSQFLDNLTEALNDLSAGTFDKIHPVFYNSVPLESRPTNSANNKAKIPNLKSSRQCSPDNSYLAIRSSWVANLTRLNQMFPPKST